MKNFEDTGIKKLISLIKAKFDSLAKVATSGSYNDLSDKPTIPSVGNGKITVKQGGMTKGTFTVNQTGATTIELTDNDTHYASGTVVTNDATKTGNYGAALTNGNVYLNHVENGAVQNSHKITGAGATTVTSDTSGNIIITSTDNNTTYGVATASANGLMTSSDKSKLDGIAAGAQVNQKAFSQFKVGTTEIKADTETDILTLVAGENVTLTPDATNDRITITAKDTTYTSLPNPNGLRVQVNGDGSSEVRYDGSEAKTINIKAGSNITITSDSSGNITISSTASAGSFTGDVGTVVYEASSGGLYCDGKTANNSTNSVGIQDSDYKYKRLRFYCKGYYGLICTDMPLDRACDYYVTNTDKTKRYGGVIFPGGDNSNIDDTGIGASNHWFYELKWRVEKETAGWRVRVVDSGWLGLNAGKATDEEYTNNTSTSNAGTGYVSWNQRHNRDYCIYKIVAYTV